VLVTLSGWLAGFSWRYPCGVYAVGLLVGIVIREPDSVVDRSAKRKISSSKPISRLQSFVLGTVCLGLMMLYVIPAPSPLLLRQAGATSRFITSLGLVAAPLSEALTALGYGSLKKRRLVDRGGRGGGGLLPTRAAWRAVKARLEFAKRFV
jgi:hypothetical protein